MMAAAFGSCRPQESNDDSVRESLALLEGMLDQAPDRICEADYFTALGQELRRLHARIRVRHAADHLGSGQEAPSLVPPELSSELDRVRAEHPAILGLLDRLTRSVDSMADRSLEDKEVFILRGRELIAVLRRHEAEEDRLVHLSVWRETGGES